VEPERREKWQEFYEHSKRYNENFLLAARAYAQVIARVISGSEDAHTAMSQLLSFEQADWHTIPTARHASKRRLRRLRESLTLLRHVLQSRYSDPQLGLDPLFEVGFYAALLGQFDLVNVSVEYRNVFDVQLQNRDMHEFQEACQSTGLLAEIRRIVEVVAEEDNDPSLDDDEMLPPMSGIALSRAIALTNHSCDANCSIEYHSCAVIALRPIRHIREGEEITMCYIDDNLCLKKRQAALKSDYRFLCDCTRCRIEQAEEELVKLGGPEATTDEAIANAARVCIQDVVRVRETFQRTEESTSDDTSDDNDGRGNHCSISDESDDSWSAAPRFSRNNASRCQQASMSSEDSDCSDDVRAPEGRILDTE